MPNQSRDIDRCPCCGARVAYLYTIARFQPPFNILRCPECGLQMQARRPEDPAAYYNEDYYAGRAEYSYRDERARLAYDAHVWRARLRNIARYVPPPADFLDVGCAFGGFVETAGAFGYRARGLDISEHAVREGRKRGLDLEQGTLEALPCPAGSFDVVTLVEVIEHLSDPVRFFQALRDTVRPGGLAVIQTANFLGRQARRERERYHYYLPGHLFYYSAANLKRFLNQYGFDEVVIYRPVDFGLLPKLLKSRGDFKSARDYLKWFRIAVYHMKGKIAWGDFALTSSMVVYARRAGSPLKADR